MTEKEITIDILQEVAEGLRENLHNLVFIGGIASFLYHFKTGTEPILYTYDLDTVFSKNSITKDIDSASKTTGHSGLRKKIEKIGFEEIPGLGRGKSSGKFITEKWGSKGKKVTIELLLPLRGKPRGWGQIEPGLKAEALRYLDILIDNLRQVELGDGLVINIPHPARFVIQKLLVYEKRKRVEEKEKDAAYIADVINLYFRDINFILEEIKSMNEEYSKAPETKSWIKRAIDIYRKLFGEIISDGTVAASDLLNIDSRIINKQAERFIVKLDKI